MRVSAGSGDPDGATGRLNRVVGRRPNFDPKIVQYPNMNRHMIGLPLFEQHVHSICIERLWADGCMKCRGYWCGLIIDSSFWMSAVFRKLS
jgi:hypothetical protein